MTNREWLESLSDKELAGIVTGFVAGKVIVNIGLTNMYYWVMKDFEEWLQAEHEETDDE